jgi:hypothetical protein
MTEITNHDVAVLHKFNQLAERHGLNPTDFIVSMHTGRDGTALVIEATPHDEKDLATAKKILAPLGFAMPEDGGWTLQAGDTRDIYSVLADAVGKAPRPRTR